MEAGQLLREARVRHGLSREALAIRAATAESAIDDIETGRASTTIEALTELLHLLGEDLVLESERWETGIDLTLNQANLELSTERRVRQGLQFADFVRRHRGGGADGLGRSLRSETLLRSLDREQVDFVVVGSVAGLVHGSAYPTYDLDIAFERRAENLDRILSALQVIGVSTEFSLSARANLSLDTPHGTLDLLGKIPGIRSYDELRQDARRELISEVSVLVASLDHLIAMKRASSKRKDQLMAMEYVELAELERRAEECDGG
jgi:transcriptional regulator with XRE-family HTH domain